MRFELDPFNRNITDEELLNDLKSVNSKLDGKSLTFRLYRELGKYSPSTLCERFGSWNSALKKIDLVPGDKKNITMEELFDNLREVWIAKGRQPVYRDMSVPPSQINGSTYNARFGGWRAALKEFIEFVKQEENELASPHEDTKTRNRQPRKIRNPSLSMRFRVLKRDNFRCVACGRSPASTIGLKLEVDHILPWSKGGETIIGNLRSLCFDCNRGKSNS